MLSVSQLANWLKLQFLKKTDAKLPKQVILAGG